MPNYSKVQFIAWEIYTGPVYQNRLADHYPGITPALGDRRWDVLRQCLDISARVQFTKKALDAAYESADQDENTLKVFMAPEFLYRGAAGAYLFDLLNGWEEDAPSGFGNLPQPYGHHWGGLWGELRALAAEEKIPALGLCVRYRGGRCSPVQPGPNSHAGYRSRCRLEPVPGTVRRH